MNLTCPSTLLRTVVRHPLTDVTLFARHAESGVAVAGIFFGSAGTLGREPAKDSNCTELRAWAQWVRGYLSGRVQSLKELPVDFAGCTPFAKSVLAACQRIPYGATVSYARLAAMAGRPGAARAAASVMRNNRFVLAVPCHRVIASDGGLGGFMGATNGEPLALKRALLEMERRALRFRSLQEM
jgi:O-6-methylguanine DNA methyltransferase